MAIYARTADPQGLVDKIKDYINKGKIDTWKYDSDGDFTHSASQWNQKAWFRPRIESDRVVFGILGNTKSTMTKEVYAIYHGRFIEMLLAHFDDIVTLAWASSQKTTYDNFK